MAPPIYVINRASDRDRLAGFAASAAALDVPFTRIEAFDGHDPDAPFFLYRDLIPDRFWGDETIKPGAFACAISHLAAWRRMIADGAEAALICEDDARLIAAPAPLSASAYDVLFANERTTDWRAAAGDHRATPSAAADIVAALGAASPPTAPGADAYFVSRAGAEKLIAMACRARIVAGVDWLMLAHGLAPGAAPWPELASIDSDAPDERDLRVLVAASPIAARADGPSVLNHGRRVPLAGFAPPPALDMPVPTRMTDDPAAQDWREGRYHEEPALEMMRRWMPPGGLFVDIGAHLGNHTLFMLRHGGAGRAVVFEPHGATADALSAIIAAAGLDDRVDTSRLGFGLAEEQGKREAKGARGSSYAMRLRPGFDEGVRVRPGDALIRDARPAMIKIDVGGEEREVLKGLRRTLKRDQPLVVIDLTHPKSGKAQSFLDRLGYHEIERARLSVRHCDRLVALHAMK